MNYIIKINKKFNYKNYKKSTYIFNIQMHKLGFKKQNKFNKKIGFILKKKLYSNFFLNKQLFFKWTCLTNITFSSCLKKQLFKII